MFINELFDESVNPLDGSQIIDDLHGVHPKHHEKIQNLARFHRVDVHFDPVTKHWMSNKPLGDHPFIRDAKHITSAAAHYGMNDDDGIREAKRPFKQGAVTDYPTSKRLNKGVDKIYARVLQRQIDRENGETVMPAREEVAVMVDAHPGKLSYGILRRIGRSGAFHVKLNGGKLKDWAAGDEIAVQPHEVYATWDPKLQGMTTVHREYNNDGSKTVHEARGLAQVTPYIDLLQSMGWFISMQTVAIAQDAVDNNAQQELKKMQLQFRSPILNGMNFADVCSDPTVFKNPKVAPILMKYVYDMLGYMEPRIKKYIRPDMQNRWITQIDKLKDQYRNAVTYVSGQKNSP